MGMNMWPFNEYGTTGDGARRAWYFMIKTRAFNKMLCVTCVSIWNMWWVMVQKNSNKRCRVCKYRISMNTGFLLLYIRGITSPHWKFSWIMCSWDNLQVYNTMRYRYNAVIFWSKSLKNTLSSPVRASYVVCFACLYSASFTAMVCAT